MGIYKISSSVCEDKGKVRNNNEDNFYLNGVHLNRVNREYSNIFSDIAMNNINVYAVFDGMGGEEFGEEASLIAAEVTKKIHYKINQNPSSNVNEEIISSIDEANTLICNKIRENGRKRIGATYASLVIKEDSAQIYNVGDSRVYLLRNNQLHRISIDDTTVQRLINIGMITERKAKTHPERHRLTQHLGIFNHEMIIEPHISKCIKVLEGDKFLLCSDGLTDMVEDSDIEQILNGSNNSNDISQALVAKALENGGKDNVTAMVVCVERENKPIIPVKKKTVLPSFLLILTCIILAVSTIAYFGNKHILSTEENAVIENFLVDNSIEIIRGKDATIYARPIPEKMNGKLKFKSLDENIATVNSNGIVHGNDIGKTNILVTSGKLEKQVVVVVKENKLK